MEEDFTTGQKLLASMHNSEAVRKARYAGTVQAKMKEARDKLNMEGLAPKHPVKSEMAIFGNSKTEVHQLLTDAGAEQPGLGGIAAMLARKADRHEAAWQQFCISKDLARQQHDAAAASAAMALKAMLDGVTRDIEQDMAMLAENKVMVLNEQQILQVWETVAQRCMGTAAWIDGLGADFKAVEAALQSSVEAALRSMVADMTEIAHLDEGRIQRLMEQEAVQLNQLVLENRQVAAEVLQRLHTQQVLQEQALRQRWEAAREAWRTLCSRHAIHCFCEHVKADLAEPAARLDLFARLRALQDEAHGQLKQLCIKLGQLLPPHLSSEAAAGWVLAAQQWNQRWQQQLGDILTQLRDQEKQLEQQAQAGLTALRDEVLGYKGFTADQLEPILHEEVQPVLESRRTAAQQLLQQSADFLERQAAEWQLATQVLSNWLTSLVMLFEDHKSKHAEGEINIKALLRAARQQFEQADAEREAALDAAILSVSQGTSEAVLNQKVEDALQLLAAIQAGYRAYATSATEAVKAYPARVKQQEELYNKCLCGVLHVQARSADTAGEDDTKQQLLQLSMPGADTAASICKYRPANSQQQPRSVQGSSAQQQLQQQSLELPGGSVYVLPHDLWSTLLEATPKPWHKQLPAQRQPDVDPAAASGNTGVGSRASSTAGGTADANSAAATATLRRTSSNVKPQASAGKLTPKQKAEAAAAATTAAAEAALAAEEAAVAAAAELAAANAPPPGPVAQDGTELCQTLPVPADAVQTTLQQIQESLLSEMEAFSSRSLGSAGSWAEAVEGMLIEELDSRLRAHRPRAGRIEEEVRAARSIELLAQRRRVEAHMRLQSKAVQQQATDFEDSIAAIRQDAAAWKNKILGYERLLGNAMSLKGVDICWREAQAQKVKLDKQLIEEVERLKHTVDTGCTKIVEDNRFFESANFKLLAEGGTYAEENVATYKAGISGIDHHLAQQQQKQQEQLVALQQELSADLSAALTSIEQLLPSHKQDMALIETLNRYVEGARKNATLELIKNTKASAEIDAVIQQLQDSVSKAAENQKQQLTQPANALKHCQQFLEEANDLRHRLLKQAQVLELLQSQGSLSCNALCLMFPSELQVLVLPDFNGGAPTAAAASSADAAATSKAARSPTPQKGSAARASVGPAATKGGPASKQSQAVAAAASSAAVTAAAVASAPLGAAGGADMPAVSLAKDIRAVIDTAKQEVEIAAKAYYAAKDSKRPIRYPAKIAPSLKELMAGVDTVLSGLTQMLQQHMGTASKQLRMQVVQANRLLERVPAAVVQLQCGHLLAATQQQQATLLGEYAKRRQALEQQLQQHKASLHPSMLHPNRSSELEDLKTAESARQSAAADLTSACATNCLALISSHASQVSAAVAELCKLLLNLLDGCVMPGDLVAAAEGEADALAGLQQRSMLQLERLALAQEEAAPTGPAPPPAAAAAAGLKAGGKPGKAGDDAKDAAAAAAAVIAISRQFAFVSWRLTPGNFSEHSLGWLPADQQAVDGAAKAVTAVVGVAVTAATASVAPGGGPLSAKQAASGTPNASAAAAPPKTPPTAAAPPAATSASVAQQPQADGDARAIVVGYDTPCQRAVIRAQRAAMHQTEQRLAAAVADLKQSVYQWLGQEQQWGAAWARMIDELDMV